MDHSANEFVILQEDIDVFGHLNNARYILYFEKARLAFQEPSAVGAEFRKAGYGLWVRDQYVRVMRQLKAGQTVKVKSRYLGRRGVFVYLFHEMLCEGKRSAICITEHFLVRTGESPTPLELTPELLDAIPTVIPGDGPAAGVMHALAYWENEEREERVRRLKGS